MLTVIKSAQFHMSVRDIDNGNPKGFRKDEH